MKMSKQLLIDYELFFELVKYHCFEMYDDPVRNAYIKEQLEQKVNKLADREKYAQRFRKPD